ncbi:MULTISPECIES: hypothetical protein [unclassified Tolypothrix]|uniref:hypothetical protein n=1 Tax=unclassified Tolypothrix TaxID=2649714 RepID=UPI0005EABBF5|nr:MULTISPECIES: hypothetical protein [unclassified Tolypothrix]EKF00212.1 hypothetical protein FDUTEX481_09185 [Tolypothrix sp. PCC 7601]MBE9087844.1 hypothetical protein [Tolypothrix sp. LEGE 11397]UYD27105.1 hypothetical protein HGR01_03070 [Tolypothrix sp. PCC 7712]UYD37035.1 hypothetical protein HG267_15690 [Tolypothrix sp. PCC 7601]
MALANNSSQGRSQYAIYNLISRHRQECDYLALSRGQPRDRQRLLYSNSPKGDLRQYPNNPLTTQYI